MTTGGVETAVWGEVGVHGDEFSLESDGTNEV